jgi:hypothetical protein
VVQVDSKAAAIRGLALVVARKTGNPSGILPEESGTPAHNACVREIGVGKRWHQISEALSREQIRPSSSHWVTKELAR